MSIVIGLHGSKGSGKDYFYQVVKTSFPDKDIRKVAYADPIKNKVMFIFGLTQESEYDEFKRSIITYTVNDREIRQEGRHIVREIGMMMRDYDPQQFVRYVESMIKSAPNSIWCITDLRFENEYESIRNVLGGKIVKIKRTGFDFDGHVTETEFATDRCDYTIFNITDISTYEEDVRATYSQIIMEGAK